MHNQKREKRAYLWMLLCPLVLVCCVALARPQAEMAMNDDWSYIISAKVLAATGHLTYNGWATAMLGWQLYWGALFIKLFGFSFLVMRISMLVVAMASLAVMQRLFVRLGLTEQNSVLATLTFGLSPLFYPLAFSFMSDVPGMLAILLCCYGCVRAVQSSSERNALLWLVAAAASNVVGGTARQVAWLGFLTIVPGAAWILRRSSRIRVSAVVLWIVSVVSIVLCMRWFRMQPYSIGEPLIPPVVEMRIFRPMVADGVRGVLALALWSSPVLIAFVWRGGFASRRAKWLGVAVIVFATSAISLLTYQNPRLQWLAPFAMNTIGVGGLGDFATILGARPVSLSFPVRIVLTAITAMLLTFTAIRLWPAPSRPDVAPPAVTAEDMSWRNLFILFGPFVIGYVGLFLSRSTHFDRYLLPVFAAALLVFMKLYQQRVSMRLPAVSWLALALMMVFAVTSLHDVFAFYQARVTAANELTSAGVPRIQFSAGFDYDGWTQIEAKGYVNDARLRVPAGAYRPWVPPANTPSECIPSFANHVPAIHVRYALSHQLLPCLRPTDFPAVTYKTWLPIRTNQLIIGEVR